MTWKKPPMVDLQALPSSKSSKTSVAEGVMTAGWVVLLCPRGAERELRSAGEWGYRPFRVTDSQGREQSVVVVPQRVAQSGLANGPGGYAYTDDPAFARGGLVAALACAEVRPVIGTHSVLVVRLS